MDHSWRPRPMQGNNICPTCSISHFPFCPPRPSFNENPRFHPHNDYYMQRPPFDPYLDHYRAHTPNLHRPFVGDPSDGLPDPRAWHRSPSLDKKPYGQSQVGDYGYKDGFGAHSYDGHGSIGAKRMRIDDQGSSLVMGNENYANSSRNVLGSERILKLIHDHGNPPGGLPQGWPNSMPETSYETKRYVHGRSEEVRGVQDDYFDRSQRYFHGDHGLNSHRFREEPGLPHGPNSIAHESREKSRVEYGQHSTMSTSNDRYVESRYDPIEDSIPHSFHAGGNNSYPAGRFTSMNQAKQREDDLARHYEGSIPYDPLSQKFESKQQPPMNAHYGTSEYPNDTHHSIQRIHQSGTASVKEQQYSCPANNQLPFEYKLQHQMPPNGDFHLQTIPTELRHSVNIPLLGDSQGSAGQQNSSPYGLQNLNGEHRHPTIPTTSTNLIPRQDFHIYGVQPPLPTSPPPPFPLEPSHYHSERFASPRPPPPPPPPKTSSSLFPIAVSSRNDVPASHTPVPKVHSSEQTYFANKPILQASTAFPTEDFQANQSSRYMGERQPFRHRHLLLEKLQVVDASQIFKQPHRATRPDRIVIILRGLPGSGKSYLAKMLRDLEVENGGNAPRVHSMDEYFMIEVEKIEETEVSKSSGYGRGKRTVTKNVMEYCYEPEMEEAYRSSMLKAFKKTIDEGGFSLIIVDDRNLRVADFAQFWATAKRSGYEVYLLEAAYKDPTGCAARNVHGFSQDDIQKMAGQWEEAPPLYLKLDIKSLLHGDDLEETGIQEVDMDMEDGDPVDCFQESEVVDPGNAVRHPVDDLRSQSPSNDEKKGYNDGSHLRAVKELHSSKWSDVLDEDDSSKTEGKNANSGALYGLIQAYSKEGKSVRWGDQGGNIGFSIGAAKRANVSSLVIGPGSGYNLKSNPLPLEEKLMSARDAVKSKSQNVFRERMRAEHESFKAVFDKRRQRIGGFGTEED